MGQPLDFLDARHRLYDLWLADWRMNERRAFGKVQLDLLRFLGEDDQRYAKRQDKATYRNFMHAHAASVTGQLRQQGAPDPNSPRFSFGALGRVRPTEEIRPGDGDFGELIYYNVDGVGGDGSEWPVFFDSVDERSQHIGHRILMIEAPPRRVITRGAVPVEEPELSRTDFLAGVRPYGVEFSPAHMPMWLDLYGRREFCILRVAHESGKVVDGQWTEPVEVDATGAGLGYYLLVRRGCTVLGPNYERGGYWLYSPEKKLVRTGDWNRTRGEIPLWYHFGEKSRGTEEHPAESRSVTEGLGRVGAGLMDMMSARDWDAFDAARSGKWMANAGKEIMQDIKEQWDAHSLHIGVPPHYDERSNTTHPVTILDDSAGAVAPAVFQAIIDAKFLEAKEESYQALTSTPGSSGWSKEAGFLEVKAPHLARRASYRQQSEQNAVRFFEMRMGQEPTGFVSYKREYNLTPVVDDIERAFDLLRRTGLRSALIEPELAIMAIQERLGSLPAPPPAAGVDPILPEEHEAAVRQELRESVERANRSTDQATSLAASFGGGL